MTRRNASHPARALGWGMLLALLAAGCKPPAVTFPAEPLAATAAGADYDIDGDGTADFFFLANAAGRYDRIAYDRDGDGKPDQIVHLDAIRPQRARHLVIVLDGIPFDVLKAFYQAGHLRLCHPPAELVPPYPVMTDLALEDVFGHTPCDGFEAKFFRRSANRLVGGTSEYLAGKNEPFKKIIQYRAPTMTDGLAYLKPRPYFRKEIHEVKRLWDRRETMETIAYVVSSAAMGSRLGEAGQTETLRWCERLMYQAVYETAGLVKVTLLADHGQTNVPCQPAGLRKYLKAKKWRLVQRLRNDRDVALVDFGLVTCAAMSTRSPAELARDLIASPKVTLASYADGDAVVVLSRDGEATIRSADGKTFEYTPRTGDPLKLADLAKGPADGRAILKATVAAGHEYPDALYRLWRAHFALAENPPDVIVSLDDRYYHGSAGFAGAVKMASTHGGLNRANSTTFIMSSAGKIEGPLRSEDVPDAMRQLFARPFPLGR